MAITFTNIRTSESKYYLLVLACVNIGLKTLKQIAVLTTRINEFYLHVKFFIIRLFTDPSRALSSADLKKTYKVALSSPYRRRLLL